MASKPHIMTGVDQISRMSALCSSLSRLLPLTEMCCPVTLGVRVGEAQIDALSIARSQGKHDERLKRCLPTSSYPPEGENIPRMPETTPSKVRLSVHSN